MKKNDYLRIFSDLFYDVRRDMEMNELIEDICEWLSGIVVRFGEILNELTLGDEQRDSLFVDTIVALFIRKIMENIDAIIILTRKCSFSPANIILRTYMEIVVSLRFILKEDTEIRAASYLLNHFYSELDYTDFFDMKSEKSQIINNILNDQAFAENATKARNRREVIYNIIGSKELFQKVDDMKARKLKQKENNHNRGTYIKWYEICSDIRSFKALTTEMGWKKYYDTLYNIYSKEAHGINVAAETRIGADGFYLKYIRDIEKGYSTFNLTGSFSICILNDLYKYMQDGEEERQEYRQYYFRYKEEQENLEMRFRKLLQERHYISN